MPAPDQMQIGAAYRDGGRDELMAARDDRMQG